MIANVAGETIAPPRPWIARKMISCVPLSASPQASSRREEHHSEHEHLAPAEEIRGAAAEEQEAAERERVGGDDPLECVAEDPGSSWIDGSATFTIATSRITMKNATRNEHQRCQRLGSGRRQAPCGPNATVREETGKNLPLTGVFALQVGDEGGGMLRISPAALAAVALCVLACPGVADASGTAPPARGGDDDRAGLQGGAHGAARADAVSDCEPRESGPGLSRSPGAAAPS